MIQIETLSAEWLKSVSSTLGKVDNSLLEKAVRALFLAEQLKINGLTFVFKGGTSLLIHLERPLRFSIDVDIITLNDKGALINAMDGVIESGAFSRWQPDERTKRKDLPVDHFKFFYKSQFPSPTPENNIILDVLYQPILPAFLQEKEMLHPWLKTHGEPTRLTFSTIGGLLGDKLTAFAPATSGILYAKNRPVEIIKQLFDIGCLFDLTEDLSETSATFQSVALQELKYRELEISPNDVLKDSFQAALTICDRNLNDPNFQHLAKGIFNIKPSIFSRFVIEDAMVCAAKIMFLTTLLNQGSNRIAPKFKNVKETMDLLIPNMEFNRFNKLKRTNPEAFFYLYATCERLNVVST